MTNQTESTETEASADLAGQNERLVMPSAELSEPPFCAWCGGTCECEDFYDEDPNEGDYCQCLAIHDEEELASNRCSCCGGIVEA